MVHADRSTTMRIADVTSAESWDLPRGHLSPRHVHDEAQLLVSIAGAMRVATNDGLWVLPPQRALWIPANVVHEMRAQNAVRLRTVYIDVTKAGHLHDACKVLDVTGLLRELVLRSIELQERSGRSGQSTHLHGLLLEEIRISGAAPLLVPMPVDPRARRVANAMMDAPESRRSLIDWAGDVGASARTLTRCFSRETGMSFLAWRRIARLVRSIEYLAEGRSVTDAASSVGYESQSAYHSAFRSHFGTTPGRFLDNRI